MEIEREEQQECSRRLLQHEPERRTETGMEIEGEEEQECRQPLLQHEQERRKETGMEIGRDEEQECRQPLLQHEQERPTKMGMENEGEEEQECRQGLLQRKQLGGFKRCSREMQLLEFRDKFVFRSVDPDAPDVAFSIGRTDGVLQSLDGTYVLVITSREEVGSYLGVPVFLVKSLKFLSCNEALKHSTSQEKRDEAYFMTLLRTVETTPGLYYSYEGDLTLNIQRTSRLPERRTSIPLWKPLDAFSIPMIQGSIHTLLDWIAYFHLCVCMYHYVCVFVCTYLSALRWAR